MIALLFNASDNSPEAVQWKADAQANMALDAVYSVYEHIRHKLNPWGITVLPCLAVIHEADDVCVLQASGPDAWLTFADEAQAALDAYEAAKDQG